MSISNREVVLWPINDLREHPRQHEMFPEHPPNRFRSFVEDIRKNGLRDPTEIKPDGTILDGHHRVKAGKELGWTTIEVVVLNEFTDAGEAAELHFMYSRNAQRRQMTELDLARAFRTMKISMGKASSGELRDEIASLLGCPKKGRTLERLEKVLDMPPAIQTAFSWGTLKKTVVYKIASLPPHDQQVIATRLEQGDDPSQVIEDYPTLHRHRNEDTPQDLYYVLMDFLNDSLDTLAKNCESIVGSAMKHEHAAEILSATEQFCMRMREQELMARQSTASRVQAVVRGLAT